MSSGRLLLAALLLFALPTFAQETSLLTKNDSRVQPAPDFRTPAAATASEPWRILPNPDSAKESIVLAPDASDRLITSDGPVLADTTCLAIRSYVVARDSKDSDSVHLVRYTTCVPAKRFGLKTTEGRVTLTR